MSFKPITTKSAEEAIESLFVKVLPLLPALAKEVIEADYQSAKRFWKSSDQLIEGKEADIRAIVSATLSRMAIRRDFSHFQVELDGPYAEVSSFLKEPIRFIPLRIWRGEASQFVGCNLKFYNEVSRFQPSDFGA